MQVIITNAGGRGPQFVEFLKNSLSKHLSIKNISTKGCWLETGEWNYGNFTSCGEEFFPQGRISFDVLEDFHNDRIMMILSSAFSESNTQFEVPELKIKWLAV